MDERLCKDRKGDGKTTGHERVGADPGYARRQGGRGLERGTKRLTPHLAEHTKAGKS